MKIEIEFSDAVIRDAVIKQWARMFNTDGYERNDGEGAKLIHEQVKLAVLSADYTTTVRELVASCAKNVLPNIVREAVVVEVAKLVKAEVKRSVKEQSLFNQPEKENQP